jgi:hypothetical protein
MFTGPSNLKLLFRMNRAGFGWPGWFISREMRNYSSRVLDQWREVENNKFDVSAFLFSPVDVVSAPLVDFCFNQIDGYLPREGKVISFELYDGSSSKLYLNLYVHSSPGTRQRLFVMSGMDILRNESF